MTESLPRMFTLSLFERTPLIDWIIEGRKRWEFRRNPHFGEAQRDVLRPGDPLFLVGVDPGSEQAVLRCRCTVGRILRDAEMGAHFGDPSGGAWREAACEPGTARDWAYFLSEILEPHRTAVELLDVRPLRQPLACDRVLRKKGGAPWTARGLFSARGIRRYELDGQPFPEALLALPVED